MSDQPSILFVHAHPDDECIPTGVTLAKYAAAGARVTLVTCTLGEVGEIVDPDLAHLDADALGKHREAELDDACRVLGVTDHRFLGGVGRWRDSGMMGTPENDDPRCFWRADLDEAGAALADVIREVRPQVVVTYDENGGYGHPDHIQTHRVTMAALDAAGDGVRKVYYTALPKSALAIAFDYFKETGSTFFQGAETVDDLPFGTPDDLVTTVVHAPDQMRQKEAAMRAHRSQIAADGPFFSLPPDLSDQMWSTEHFILARGALGPDRDERGWETDLFAGLG